MDAIVKACFERGSTKEGFEKDYLNNKDFQWTLTHNDTQYGNFVWNPAKSSPMMIDMELAGIGSGPADLAIWMFIRTNPEWRRKHEDEILKIYYEALIESGSKCDDAHITRESYTLEQCEHDYAFHGFVRCQFYLLNLAASWGQHVVDDLLISMTDLVEKYGITEENVPGFTY